MPKVSVIIPCYNQGAWIGEAINSVLSQTYTVYDIIVVNDGSTDEATLVVLKTLEQNNITVLHTLNKGVSAARNHGIAHSKAEFILPLDADDRIDKDFLLKTIPMLENNDSLQIIGTGAQYFGELNDVEILPAYLPEKHLLQNLFFNTSLFRKNRFNAIGGYDETFMDGWEDWDLFLRLIQNAGEVYVIEEPLLQYRIKTSSRNADLLQEKKLRVEQQLYLKHLKKYLEYYPEPIQSLRDNFFLKGVVSQFERYKTELNRSASYRLGHFILSPFKWMRKQKK